MLSELIDFVECHSENNAWLLSDEIVTKSLVVSSRGRPAESLSEGKRPLKPFFYLYVIVASKIRDSFSRLFISDNLGDDPNKGLPNSTRRDLVRNEKGNAVI
jgi:hypothetical protein